MVGGIVVGVAEYEDGTIRVMCAERKHWKPNEWSSAAFVRVSSIVEVAGEKRRLMKVIKPGDSLWWQGDYAYWTPYPEVLAIPKLEDTRLDRIGCSIGADVDLIDVTPQEMDEVRRAV